MKKRIVKIIATAMSVIMLMSCISMFSSISANSSFKFEDNEDGTSRLVEYNGNDANVVIPTYSDSGKLVTTIYYDVFSGNANIKTVSIPLGVTVIEDGAFYGCANLESVSVSRVESIGWYAFANCTSLEKIVIPETVVVVEKSAYEGAENAESVNVVNPVLGIAEDAFDNCPNLTIYGYPESTAEDFAEKHGFEFESIEPEDVYGDMNPNHWWYNAINFVTAYDLLPGKIENGESKFKPADNITRADAMRILWAFEGKPVGYTSTFTDVPALYADAIGWAQAKGISSGTTATTFGSDNTVTKVQLITFLYNYAKYKNYDTNITGYTVPSTMTDLNKVPSYAQNAVKWAAKNNIITTNGAFSPNSNATRAVAATVIYMFMGNVEC